ncbi:MAG: NAD(P)/FAD-dependent oxidoreductase [Pseudomonadota bacterium]
MSSSEIAAEDTPDGGGAGQSTNRYDAIVVGGGHNGMVAAILLARAGRKVVLLEADSALGGAARPHALADSGIDSALPQTLMLLHPDVIKVLDLEAHGLSYATAHMPTVALDPERGPLVLRGAFGATIDGDLSDRDRTAWTRLRPKLMRYASVLGGFLTDLPPRLGPTPLSEKSTLGKLGFAIRRLGRDDMREFLRMLLINVADVLEDDLLDDRLKGAVALDAVIGTNLGPRSPTSILPLYYRLAGEIAGAQGAIAQAKGGMAAVTATFARAAEHHGVEIRTGAEVDHIQVDTDRVTGVALAGGEIVQAPIVVSAINPKTTLIDLVGTRYLETDLVRRLGNLRMQGTAAKLTLALRDRPTFTGVSDADHAGRLLVAPSINAVETAFNAVKYGRFSDAPVMEITLPTVADPDLTPGGQHILSAIVQYAPHNLAGGWDKGKAAFEAVVLDTLERHAPGIGMLITAQELLTPADIETRYRMPGGHWHHGELAVDQMFMLRPTHQTARYRTQIQGLWLASAGSHPGGGITGVPGLNAARAIIESGGQ